MSLKRKLICCASSSDFKFIQISSGSETESANEEVVPSLSDGEITNKKRKTVPKNLSSKLAVEVLLVDEFPVERKGEIVWDNESKKIKKGKKICSDEFDSTDSDQEITFLKVENSVQNKKSVKSLAELAGAECKYPSEISGK